MKRTALLGLLMMAGCTSMPSASSMSSPVSGAGRQVVVYYMHGTFRCHRCNAMESMVHDALKEGFAKELAAGTVKWETANYQERRDLASRYGVSSSSVVVVSFDDGRETGHQRLDDLWGLRDDPPAFRRMLAEAIDTARGKVHP